MGLRSVCCTVATSCIAILLTSCTDDTAPPLPASVESSADLAAIGHAVWKKGSCTTCHGPEGAGNNFGPDLTDGIWVNSDGSAEGIRTVLIDGVPKDQMKSAKWPMPMPSATVAIPDDDDIDALVAYVQSLSSTD